MSAIDTIKQFRDLLLFRYIIATEGKQLMKNAKQLIKSHQIREADTPNKITEEIKTGLFAGYFDYAHQVITALDKIPENQKTIGNELDHIKISQEFVQEMAPSLSEWEFLHHFRYAIKTKDVSGSPVETVKESAGQIYLSSLMGLTYQMFKKEIGVCLKKTPVCLPEIGPAIAYREIKSPAKKYFLFNPFAKSSKEYS